MTPCTHDRCQQGRAPCPTPQACHMPEHAQPANDDDSRDPVEVAGKWAIALCCLFALIGAISMAAGWLSVRL